MYEPVEIKGGADEFEAAVIAILLDHLAREDAAARHRSSSSGPGLPAWLRATPQLLPHQAETQITPDRR
jgi:hypothetical protein